MKYIICTNSIEETKKRLEAYSKEEAEIGFVPWTTITKADTEVIGWGGLTIDPFDPGWGIEVIFFVHPKYWGKGYGTEVVKISITEGLNFHNIDKIHAFAHPDNIGSIRVLMKNGVNLIGFEDKLYRNHYQIVKY